jgi:hypothetical protein
MAEFWTWSLYKNKDLSFDGNQEVTGSKKTQFSNFLLTQKGDTYWAQKKCTTNILHDWDVRHFPFDRQHLTINLEDASLDVNALMHVPDVENSKMNGSLKLDEWNIDSFSTRQNLVNYNTTYGDPTLHGESTYSAVSCDIYLTRLHSWVTFFKLVTGVYVAFLIALLVFRVQPPSSESRIGLAVGGLFAAVGNKYIVESVVPTSTQTTLIDLIHLATFGAILVIVMLTIWITRLDLDVDDNAEEIAILDKRAMIGTFISYLLLNIFLIYRSLS